VSVRFRAPLIHGKILRAATDRAKNQAAVKEINILNLIIYRFINFCKVKDLIYK
jgi:hypothetical protein